MDNQDESDLTAVLPNLTDSAEDTILPDWKMQIGVPYGAHNHGPHSADSTPDLIDLEDTYASDSVR